jgi:hypothetical protein
VDIWFYRDEVTLTDYHLSRCEETGLPYDNIMRKNKERLSGLHFVKVGPYFDVMMPVIEDVRGYYETGFLKIYNNERILIDMVQRAGLAFPPIRNRRHHGFHIGISRAGYTQFRKLMMEDKFASEYRKAYKQIEEWMKEPLFELVGKSSQQVREQGETICYWVRSFL